MSSSKFEEKRRVAHASNPASEALRQQLAFKKQTLSTMASRINTPMKVAPIFNKARAAVTTVSKNGSAPKKSRKGSDDDDDDFLVDDEEEEEELSESEEEMEDMGLSDEEDRKRKKPSATKPKPSIIPRVTVATNGVVKNDPPKKKERTLSDDSDEEEGGWIAKPRMQTSKVAQRAEPKKPKKKIVISSSEDEKEETLDDGWEESDEDVIKPVKKVVIDSSPENAAPVVRNHESKKEKKKKEKNKKRGGSYSDDEDDDMSGSGDDAREETDSDDSNDGALSSAQQNLRAKTLEFFNGTNRESLLAAPRIVDRIADVIMDQRPFETFEHLVTAISSIPRVSGRSILDAYMEHLENRGVLEQILDDCRVHSSQVRPSQESEQVKEHVELPLLTTGMKLHPYQQDGVDWLVEMHHKHLNCVLADEMGLGKTIQIIAFLSWLKKEQVRGPHLIVVPSSTVENWMSEMKKWCPTLKFITYYGGQDERKDIRKAAKRRKETVDVLLTTYNMIGSKNDDRKFFKHFSINYIIFDEGHMLKNCATERYRSLMKIKAQRKILLTGTPLQNNLIELISLMYFTITKIFDKYCHDVGQLLSHFKQQRAALEDSDGHLYQSDRIEQAKAILQPYILRRVKSQVLVELPPKTEEVVEVDMDDEQSELYMDTVESLQKLDNGETSGAYGGLMRLRQAANHPLLRRRLYEDTDIAKIARVLCSKEKTYSKKKWEHVAEELESYSDFQVHQLCEKFPSCNRFLLEESLALKSGKLRYLDDKLPEIKEMGDKVLIFSQFTSMLDILEVYLRLRGHSYARLDGSTPVLERLEMINMYNEDPSQFVFLLSTKAGGLGINLVSANHIIIHDIDFNPYNDKQAEDRCHRMGQTKPVYVTRLISKDTIEVDMNRIARMKLQLEKDVTKGSRGLADDGDDSVSSDEVRNMLAAVVQRSPTKNGSIDKNGTCSLRKSTSKSPTKRRNSRGE